MNKNITIALVSAALVGGALYWWKRRKPCCAACAGGDSHAHAPAVAPLVAEAPEVALFTPGGGASSSSSAGSSSAGSLATSSSGCTTCNGGRPSPVAPLPIAEAPPFVPTGPLAVDSPILTAPTTSGGGGTSMLDMIRNLNLGVVKRW